MLCTMLLQQFDNIMVFIVNCICKGLFKQGPCYSRTSAQTETKYKIIWILIKSDKHKGEEKIMYV